MIDHYRPAYYCLLRKNGGVLMPYSGTTRWHPSSGQLFVITKNEYKLFSQEIKFHAAAGIFSVCHSKTI